MQSEISRLGAISPAAKYAILRECKGGQELDGDSQPIARCRPSALIQAMQELFRNPTHLPGWDSPLDNAFAALPLLSNRGALLERCELVGTVRTGGAGLPEVRYRGWSVESGTFGEGGERGTTVAGALAE